MGFVLTRELLQCLLLLWERKNVVTYTYSACLICENIGCQKNFKVQTQCCTRFCRDSRGNIEATASVIAIHNILI